MPQLTKKQRQKQARDLNTAVAYSKVTITEDILKYKKSSKIKIKRDNVCFFRHRNAKLTLKVHILTFYEVPHICIQNSQRPPHPPQNQPPTHSTHIRLPANPQKRDERTN